jgi:hypothetical protein
MIPQILVWNPITVDASGNPLVPGDTITYEVFFNRSPFIVGNQVSLGIVTTNEATINLSSLPRGYYYVGVQSIGTDAQGVVTRSATSWSNDTVAVNPLARFAYLVTGGLLLSPPVGLRTVNP